MRWAGLFVLLSFGGCSHHSNGPVDPCSPNPCDGDHSVCSSAGDGTASCACPPGTHDSAGVCVLDQGCAPDSCSQHGTCTDSDGAATCACDNGFAPPRCA